MIGTRLGPWIIDRELGRGGMGTVYLAHRAAPLAGAPEQVALKVLAPELSAEEGFRQRFRREIDVLRQLDHPHIVHFYEAGDDGGRYFYAMELVDGPSLEKVVERDGQLPWREVFELAWQLAPALKHAHDRGVIHRDLKPANLLRGPDGLVKLSDFGIASLFASPHLTVTGGIIGTPEYLSPEQAAGKPVTRRSDLYAFGVCLYVLLTGRAPFEGEPLDLLHKHRFAQFDRPIRIVPDLHPDLDEIVCELMEKAPEKRPSDGGVLFRRLDSLRRKLARQTGLDEEVSLARAIEEGAIVRLGKGEGPATLMSRLVREELESQNKGGPIQRTLNRPAVLLVLFALTVSAIAWAFWPMSAETMYQRGAALMESSDPDDWDHAWSKYLGPLKEKCPDGVYQEKLEQLRALHSEKQAEHLAEAVARRAGPMSEGQRFFQEGLRLRQQGDETGARRTWEALIAGFGEVPAERPWARRAEQELSRSGGSKRADRPWRGLREAIARARALEAEGKKAEATAILDALRRLYRHDKDGLEVLERELAKGG